MTKHDSGLHFRNKHTGRYDFKKLIAKCPELAPFVAPNSYRELSVDFSDRLAVLVLNRALLKSFYDMIFWDIPEGFLCPPIPGRADYIHHIADLLAACNRGKIPRGPQIRVLDIGVGASCIYPIIGNCEYGWSFVGSEVDDAALASAKLIVGQNPRFKGVIEIRKQESPGKVFDGLIRPAETFELSVCNPPFHASLREARESNRQKWRKLGKKPSRGALLNFGGKEAELWCPGGERAFITRMIKESAGIAHRVTWFSTLVSNRDSLPAIYAELKRARTADTRTIDMAQGQKKSRLIAWTY